MSPLLQHALDTCPSPHIRKHLEAFEPFDVVDFRPGECSWKAVASYWSEQGGSCPPMPFTAQAELAARRIIRAYEAHI